MGLSITKLIEAFNLTVLSEGSSETILTEVESNRCGLQLNGFYHQFEKKRIQVIGNAESAYLDSRTPEEYEHALLPLFDHDIPCLILTNNNQLSASVLDYAKKNQHWVLSSSQPTSKYLVDQTLYLQHSLAATIGIHGVLVDVYGVGILMIGASGIGKSETAIDLIRNGHLLIADDSVLIKKISSNLLMGTSNEMTRNLIECRGIGLVNINSLFGKSAIRQEIQIELVMSLQKWDDNEDYDRLGEEFEKMTILDVELPMHKIPVRPGRSLAAIVEIGALNYRQNLMGYNVAKELNNAIKALSK